MTFASMTLPQPCQSEDPPYLHLVASKFNAAISQLKPLRSRWQEQQDEVGDFFPSRLHDLHLHDSSVWRIIHRQQRVLATLEEKHKTAYPNAIHERDPGGQLQVLCYGDDDELSGKQVVRFRAVVADYIADLAAREEANPAAGGVLTDAQMMRRAVRQVRRKINGGVTYAALDLPQALS
ncbi:hypothetical protein EV426DRAFT_619907 [Tirmania nivea]|nr:hypothetical protein EV426DRAFT_619907 [Tirmania nivea]